MAQVQTTVSAPADGRPLRLQLLRSVRVAPSILAADFLRLREQVAEVLAAGARVIHVDVMDGHFVPPITFGPNIVEALAGMVGDAGGMLDVHLMIERPDRQLEAFASAGAGSVTVHAEATPDIAYAAHLLHENGCGCGVAINPASAVGLLADAAESIDIALCMTVSPGWGGQRFIARSPRKIARLAPLLGGRAALEVDGGIDVETGPICREAGATLFVAGSALFGAPDPGEAYAALAAAVGAV